MLTGLWKKGLEMNIEMKLKIEREEKRKLAEDFIKVGDTGWLDDYSGIHIVKIVGIEKKPRYDKYLFEVFCCGRWAAGGWYIDEVMNRCFYKKED